MLQRLQSMKAVRAEEGVRRLFLLGKQWFGQGDTAGRDSQKETASTWNQIQLPLINAVDAEWNWSCNSSKARGEMCVCVC